MAEAGLWKPYTQGQGQLLPAFVDDALDRSDVESLALDPLEARYAMLGEHAYHPRAAPAAPAVLGGRGAGRQADAVAAGRYPQRMHRLLRLPWARALYAKRKTQGERPFAEIKQAMGSRRVRLRGLPNVRGEWNLVSAACNLRRLFALAAAPA
jgi:hypothetical protein